MTDNRQPKVFIGLPVYNEGRFIDETLNSLRALNYPNVEIFISDNASTDDSLKICKTHAAADPRIRLHCFETNMGAAVNVDHVLAASDGDYFMLGSAHDLWSENLISRCIEELESHPDAALTYAATKWIDPDGEEFDRESGAYDTRGMGSIGRFFSAFWGNMHPVMGVIRSKYIKEIPRVQSCVGTDLLVLTELALKGDFLYVPDAVWSRRETRGGETFKQKMARYKSKEFLLVSTYYSRFFPFLQLPWELLRIVLRANINLAEKTALLLALLPCFVARYVEGGR